MSTQDEHLISLSDIDSCFSICCLYIYPRWIHAQGFVLVVSLSLSVQQLIWFFFSFLFLYFFLLLFFIFFFFFWCSFVHELALFFHSVSPSLSHLPGRMIFNQNYMRPDCRNNYIRHHVRRLYSSRKEHTHKEVDQLLMGNKKKIKIQIKATCRVDDRKTFQ